MPKPLAAIAVAAALATTFRGWLSLAALIESTRAQPTYPHGHPLT